MGKAGLSLEGNNWTPATRVSPRICPARELFLRALAHEKWSYLLLESGDSCWQLGDRNSGSLVPKYMGSSPEDPQGPLGPG